MCGNPNAVLRLNSLYQKLGETCDATSASPRLFSPTSGHAVFIIDANQLNSCYESLFTCKLPGHMSLMVQAEFPQKW